MIVEKALLIFVDVLHVSVYLKLSCRKDLCPLEALIVRKIPAPLIRGNHHAARPQGRTGHLSSNIQII